MTEEKYQELIDLLTRHQGGLAYDFLARLGNDELHALYERAFLEVEPRKHLQNMVIQQLLNRLDP